MKVEIEIPDPRFQVGDIIRFPNADNDGAFLYRIVARTYSGLWWWAADKPTIEAREAHYILKPLPGSVYEGPEAAPYDRTGGADTENVHFKKMAGVDAKAEKVQEMLNAKEG